MAKRNRIDFRLDKLLGVHWWIPAAIAAALYVTVQWVIPAIPLSNPPFKMAGGILKPLGVLLTAVCGVVAAFLYYKQRIGNSTKKVRLLELHFPEPSSPASPKIPAVVTDEQTPRDSVSKSGPILPSAKTPAWSLELLTQLDGKTLEELVAAYFREEAFRTETTRIGADEGNDIKLFETGKQEIYAIVQCNVSNTRKPGVRCIRELLGAMTHAKVSRGVYVTTGDYTEEAIDLAIQHPVILITGGILIKDILSYSDAAKTRLMNVVTEAGFGLTDVVVSDAPDIAPEIPLTVSNNSYDAATELTPVVASDESPGASVEKESAALDFPLVEFPESKTKTAEFFGVFK